MDHASACGWCLTGWVVPAVREEQPAGHVTTSAELTNDEKEKTGFEASPRFWDSGKLGTEDRFPIMDLPFFGDWRRLDSCRSLAMQRRSTRRFRGEGFFVATRPLDTCRTFWVEAGDGAPCEMIRLVVLFGR